MGGGSSKTKKASAPATVPVKVSPAGTPEHKPPLEGVSEGPKSQAGKVEKPKKPKAPKEESFSAKKLEDLFNKYANPQCKSKIYPQGLTQFCQDLEVNPEDPTMLVMAWHLKAQDCGFFTKEEWMEGFEKLRVDSLERIKDKFVVFEQELQDKSSFREIYEYAFDFLKEAESRVLDMNLAVAMMGMLLKERYPLIPKFLEFLAAQNSIKVFNRDQWNSMLEFCETAEEDLASHDDSMSWPVIIDEFVAWLREKEPEKYPSPQEENEYY